MIPNVLADRYASPAMRKIWSAEGRIVLERDFWIAVMKSQRELGLPIPEEVIADYEKRAGKRSTWTPSRSGSGSPAMM